MNVFVFELDQASERHNRIMRQLSSFNPKAILASEEIDNFSLDQNINLIIAHQTDVDVYWNSLECFKRAIVILHTKGLSTPQDTVTENNICRIASNLVERNIALFVKDVASTTEDSIERQSIIDFQKLTGKDKILTNKIKQFKLLLYLYHTNQLPSNILLGKNLEGYYGFSWDYFPELQNQNYSDIESLLESINSDIKQLLLTPRQ